LLPMIHRLKRGELTNSMQRALTQSGILVISNPMSCCPDCPLTDECRGRGALISRLDWRGRVYGLLSVCVPMTIISDQRIRTFFRESARYLSLAIHEAQLEEKERQAEEALRESCEFTHHLLYNSQCGLAVINPDTSIGCVNAALEEMTGFSSSELVGKKAPYPWWPEERLHNISTHLKRAMRKEITGLVELFQKKSGERLWVEMNSSPVKSRGRLKYVLISWRDITHDKQLEENMRFYIKKIIGAQEEERKRISRELHDETAQSLASTISDIDTLMRSGQLTGNALVSLKQLRAKVRAIVEETRRFSHRLRPEILDRFGLVPSLELLTEEAGNLPGFDCRIEIIGSERRLPSETELGLFRIVQEALHNVIRHSRATQALVKLRFTEDMVKVEIIDNGVGFELPKSISNLGNRDKLGIISMSERARLLNGTFSVDSEINKGTTISVEVPCKSSEKWD